MSPKYDDPFKGHFHAADPRTPLFGAAGCTWPTVPGYNLFVGSTDAWGTLAWLNTIGIQFKPSPEEHSHDEAKYILNGGTPPIFTAFLDKLSLPDNRGFVWKLGILHVGLGVTLSELIVEPTNCNKSFILPEFILDNIPTGGSGSDCRIMQVEYDETRPPGGWPP